MKLQTFRNMKAMIHGGDQRRIECAKSGVLKIGATEIKIIASESAVMPNLYHGATGNYAATFTDTDGRVYDLGKISIRGGRIVPPTEVAVELMELRCRADAAEEENEKLREKIRELEGIFDTNALNFLIK